jgi:uncharacterized membrane protein YkvA (DUF1232 family)
MRFWERKYKEYEVNTKKHKKTETERVLNSRAYIKSKLKAEEYVNDNKRMIKIAGEAAKKIKSEGPIGKIRDDINASIRLIRAYASGSYKKIPWQSMTLIIASIIYFVTPIDLIPDFIIGLGFIDDAAILTWTFNAIRNDINSFVEWEKGNNA